MPSVAGLSRAAYVALARPALFRLDAERAHGLAGLALGLAQRSGAARSALALLSGAAGFAPDPRLAQTLWGQTIASPVGVAAGFDKGAGYYNALAALGFGAVEVGTVTARAQPGNARPRLFRLREDRALLNRMGFNNAGADAAARALARVPPAPGLLLGVNLGKTKATPLEQAPEDYAYSARRLGPYAGYVVVNVSSPNTPGLRALQDARALEGVVRAVQGALAEVCARPPPVLVKLAPDLPDEALDELCALALERGLAGLVATNTTVSRAGLRTPAPQLAALGDGGVSGAPLRARSLAVLRRLYRASAGRLELFGAGGIFDAQHAWEALGAGASLVQVYTGFVYEGPALAVTLARGLAERLARAGLASVREARGRDA